MLGIAAAGPVQTVLSSTGYRPAVYRGASPYSLQVEGGDGGHQLEDGKGGAASL